jgi:hypothetical protein
MFMCTHSLRVTTSRTRKRGPLLQKHPYTTPNLVFLRKKMQLRTLLKSLKGKLTNLFLHPLENFALTPTAYSTTFLPIPQQSLLDIIYPSTAVLLCELENGGIVYPTRLLRAELARRGVTVYLDYIDSLQRLKFLEKQLLAINGLEEEHSLDSVVIPRQYDSKGPQRLVLK